MHRLWLSIGRVVYWLIMPAQILILPFTKRARVLLVSDDQVLVVKGWLSDGRWELPGGGLHRGETPAVGAQRELLEETGLQLPLELFVNPQSKLFREDLKQFSYQLFVINLDVAQSVHGRWPEILDAQWLDRNQLTTSNASSDILNAMIDL